MVTLPEIPAARTALMAVPSPAYVGIRAALANIPKMEAEIPVPAAELDERLVRLELEVGELHERLDFAERLLARSGDPVRIAAERNEV